MCNSLQGSKKPGMGPGPVKWGVLPTLLKPSQMVPWISHSMDRIVNTVGCE